MQSIFGVCLLLAALSFAPAAAAGEAAGPWLQPHLQRVLDGGPGSTLILEHPEEPRLFIQVTHAKAEGREGPALLFDRPREGLQSAEVERFASVLESHGKPGLSRHATGAGQPDYEGFHFLIDESPEQAAGVIEALLRSAMGLPSGTRPRVTEF